jgi:hypothetical protein
MKTNNAVKDQKDVQALRKTALQATAKAIKADVATEGSVTVYLSEGSKKLTADAKAKIVETALDNCGLISRNGKKVNISVDVLALDLSYQRDPRKEMKKVYNLMEGWDDEHADDIVVSYRDGILYVMDGGHRLLAAILLGIDTLTVRVLEGKTRETEAAYFESQKDKETTLKPAQTFKAGMVSKDPTVAAIYTICNQFGLTVTSHMKNVARPMRAIVAARTVVDNPAIDGTDCLSWMFSVMETAWWLESRSKLTGALTSKMIFAFQDVYIDGMRKGQLDEYTSNLCSVLRSCSPSIVSAYGVLMQPGDEQRAQAMGALKQIAVGKADLDAIYYLATKAEEQKKANKSGSKKAKKVKKIS